MTQANTTPTTPNRPRIAIVADDDPAILDLVSRILRLEGLETVSCSDGQAAIDAFASAEPDVVLLDVRMPRVDGLSVCKRIRETSDVPVLVLTVLDDQRDAAAALEAGADDYVRKPFGADELRARVHALLRRGDRRAAVPDRIVAGLLVVDGSQQRATMNGADVMLTPTEFSLLTFLVRNPDRVLSHEEILSAVWGKEYADERHMLRVALSRLRLKLEASGPAMIETVPRFGYRFSAAAPRVPD